MRIVDIYRRDGDKLVENWMFMDTLHYLNMQGLDILARLRNMLTQRVTIPDFITLKFPAHFLLFFRLLLFLEWDIKCQKSLKIAQHLMMWQNLQVFPNQLCRVVSRMALPYQEKLKEKVETAARELNYQPNAIARGLIMQRTGLIGIMVSPKY